MEAPTHPDDRLRAFGNQLIAVHGRLREDLAGLRDDVEDHLAGRTGHLRDLRAHCLTFCSALERHHTGEDAVAFPLLAERHPALRPVIEELAHDHQIVTGILLELQKLLDGLGPGGAMPPERVRAELDGLAAILETHFTYEEKKIVAALNALDVPGWAASPPDFLKRP